MTKQEIQKLDTNFLGHPKPLFSLSMVELWERFAFYGIRSLLVLFMATTISKGGLGISTEYASAIYGIFAGCLYLAALPGGWITDNYLGQKKALFLGSFIIALGHISIALSILSTPIFFLGLTFIVIGTGFFKTSASVTVGMLYKQNDTRCDTGYTIFYIGINIGAFIAPLICGFVQAKWNYHLGFGIGGLGMLISLLILYFKATPELEEFHKNCTLKQNWGQPFKKSKNLTLILSISLLSIIGFFLIFINLADINPIILSKKLLIVILLCLVIYFIYLFVFKTLNKREKQQLTILIVLFFAAIFFGALLNKNLPLIIFLRKILQIEIFLIGKFQQTGFNLLIQFLSSYLLL
ncbi:MFS transporter [Campylobacter jejuni]|nr:MFS transporter [Campylobacter jejuni]